MRPDAIISEYVALSMSFKSAMKYTAVIDTNIETSCTVKSSGTMIGSRVFCGMAP